MKIIKTNIYYIDATGMTQNGTKMALAMKEVLRKYNGHIIAGDLLNKWLKELRAKRDELQAEHPTWKSVNIRLEGMAGNNVCWLSIGGELTAHIYRTLGEITE